jgi:ubiquinone/menaquinone biosynthesis C-methylase UbiE
MTFSVEQWHERFKEQSKWTAPLRAFLFSQVEAKKAQRILEVGSGTGAIINDFKDQPGKTVVGIDLLLDRCIFAKKRYDEFEFVEGNAISIPFETHYFDLVFCHYFFLWMNKNAHQAIKEMIRVTRKGGTIIALAEPDHTARIDYPPELEPLGKAQTRELINQGIDADMGRKLPQLFSGAGLKDIRFGQSGFQTNIGLLPTSFESEWSTLENDFENRLSIDEIQKYKTIDERAWKNGQRIMVVPTFYAIGTVSE